MRMNLYRKTEMHPDDGGPRTEKKLPVSTFTKGRIGEDRAVVFLLEANFNIIGRNYRGPLGEIDIIALDGDVLVFVEVKSWNTYTSENLEYGINKKKQRKIVETAKFFIQEHRKYKELAVRFDVVFVDTENITHITAAFTESL
ncbi:MAG: YraN family protein [Termitinemataceae bacterium]|nr:MAG: YraN family protein [Termitinemataceae bacterium]